MEIMKKVLIITICSLLIISMTACGKKYYEYPNAWISEDGKVRIGKNGDISINYEGIDRRKNITILSDSGQQYLHFCYDYDDNNYFWEADSYIKNNKMYLEIVVDNVTNLKGKTIVLEQEK